MIHSEHEGFHIITMDEFLRRQAMTDSCFCLHKKSSCCNAHHEKGKLIDPDTQASMKPPENRIDWNGHMLKPLWEYLRTVGHTPNWDPVE